MIGCGISEKVRIINEHFPIPRMAFGDPYANLSREDLIARLQIAESTVTEQRKVLQAKNAVIQKYTQEFAQLTADYERLINSRYTEQPQSFVREEPGLGLRVLPPLEPLHRPVYDPAAEPDVPSAQSPIDVLPGRRALVSQINFGADDIPPPKKLPNLPRTAMKDGLSEHFGYAPEPQQEVEARAPQVSAYPPVVVDISGMTVDQMRAKVDELNIERGELERQVNKVLPKGKVMSHVIREREELEAHFNDVCKVIGQIKLEIRRREK
jgi:hypothetical protein